MKETMGRDPDEEAKILSALDDTDEANLATKKKKTATERKKERQRQKKVIAKTKTSSFEVKNVGKKLLVVG